MQDFEVSQEKADAVEVANTTLVQELQKKVKDLEERHVRVAAERANQIKRLQREADVVRKADRMRLVRDWLDVIDSIERALDTAPLKEGVWYDGTCGIHRQMLDVLRKQNVVPMDTTDATFDPRQHEALSVLSMPDREPGVVVHTQRTGYCTLEGEVIRPAQVVVTPQA